MEVNDLINEVAGFVREGQTNTLNSNVRADLRALATYYR